MGTKIAVIATVLSIVLSQNCAAQDATTTIIKQKTNEWLDAETHKNITKMAGLYADSILFYGKRLGRTACLEKKKTVYDKYSDYKVVVKGKIVTDDEGTGEVMAIFTKCVLANGKEKNYPAYIGFSEVNGTWTIIEEGDKITDLNLLKMKAKWTKPVYSLIGDFNGDGKPDSGTVVKPFIGETAMDCYGGCITKIKFSDTSVPELVITDVPGGEATTLGDLNENGTDEIGFLPYKFVGCWNSYLVYTLINNKWEYAVPPITTHCDQWENGVKAIEKDKKKKGNVIIRYMVLGDPDFKIRSKSVPIKK